MLILQDCLCQVSIVPLAEKMALVGDLELEIQQRFVPSPGSGRVHLEYSTCFLFPEMFPVHTPCSGPCWSGGSAHPQPSLESTEGRRADERDENGFEGERGSLGKGKGVSAEQGESPKQADSFAEAGEHQTSLTWGLPCREPSALVICCGTRSPCPMSPSPFSQQAAQRPPLLPP